MDGLFPELTRRFDAAKPLGYLNFSSGAADARFRKFLADAFEFLQSYPVPDPAATCGRWLLHALTDLEAAGSAAFKDSSQARIALEAAFQHLPAAYRAHHADLLAHQPDAMLFTPFFLARACEAVLKERTTRPNADAHRLGVAAARGLNDYVGYRPIALLETRPQTDFYAHERVCPVPLYFPGVGVAPGRYADLIRPALELLSGTDADLSEEASYDLKKMDELSLDPRAADHFHPVNKRPNVLFGEWDPHRIDNSGYFRRFVLRQPTLDALEKWVAAGHSGDHGERRFEAAAVLAGTVLMGAGVSGYGPGAYDSTVTLSGLVQRIARYRDEFYKKLLAALPGKHGERLREESSRLKQPFAGVRQFLNAAIATERALHLQERRLAGLFAAMGFPAAARLRAANIPAPSARFGTEIRVRQSEAEFAAKSGDAKRALAVLAEAEDLLRRGIDCGAIIDPWNILGYQGLFPIFPGRDDTVRDPRAEDLILTVGRQFDRYAQALAAAGGGADAETRTALHDAMKNLAEWWDKFATPTVGDLPRVHGGERTEAAEHVAKALALWAQGRGADPAFWRTHRDGFKTPAAFAQVVDALREAGDFKAAMALLVTWLGESGPDLPLQDPAASFHRLAFHWMRDLLATGAVPPAEKGAILRRFFELLEVNADARWFVPGIGTEGFDVPEENGDDDILGADDPDGDLLDDSDPDFDPDDDDDDDDDEESEFASAYEGMTFRDSADDGTEGSVADGGPANLAGNDFALEADAERLEDRLRFLAAIARLWRSAARPELWAPNDAAFAAALGEWHRTARQNHAKLREFIDQLAGTDIPPPSSGVDGVMEFDRRRVMKGQLLDLAVGTAVETGAAARALAAVLSRAAELSGKPGKDSDAPAWEAVAVRLERAVAQADAPQARKLVAAFVPLFKHEPLLVHPPGDGGPPAAALKAQTALELIESLLTRLPRLGLLRETYQLTRLARAMERNDPPDGKRVSSFDQLFRTAVTGVVDALVASAADWGEDDGPDGPLAPALRQIADSFQKLWVDHSQTLRLSALEAVLADDDFERLRRFIKQYGADLFTVRFLNLSNVRGILSQGVAAWLDREATPDSEYRDGPTPKLIADWEEESVTKSTAAKHLETVLHALVEHYDEYRDYNTTTTQSDYGDNLYILLDFLRLKVSYDRFAWRLKPLFLAHDVLCRRGHDELAAAWREFIREKSKPLADDLLQKLTARENEHGIRVRTIRDRLQERFLQPLMIDQAAARVGRAAAAAKQAAIEGTTPEGDPAFAGLIAAVKPLADSPTGVGLDVPVWLRTLEDALRKERDTAEDGEADEEETVLPPAPILDFGELKRQLSEWDRPLGE